MVPAARFLTLVEVAEELNVTTTQVRSVLRSGKLRGIQVGGRGVWRIERAELERYIEELYGETRRESQQHTS